MSSGRNTSARNDYLRRHPTSHGGYLKGIRPTADLTTIPSQHACEAETLSLHGLFPEMVKLEDAETYPLGFLHRDIWIGAETFMAIRFLGHCAVGCGGIGGA